MTRYERHLPHWRQAGATYFATFNLADALPAAKQNELRSMRRDWEAKHPSPRTEAECFKYAQTVFRKVEKWMDAGFGKCWFGQAKYADELQRSLLHFHGRQYEMGCFVIMANHCHLVIRPFEAFQLENILGAVKRTTGWFVNEHEGQTGSLWQEECYDRIIRDEEHLYRVVQYIGRNPKNAGIPQAHWRRWMSPAWQAAGWDFVDQ